MNFSQVLSELMEKSGISAYKLAKSIDVHQTTIKNWLDGKEPRTEHLNKIADYFGVTTDYMLGNSRMKEKKIQTIEPKSTLRSIARLEDEQLSPEEDREIVNYINYLLDKKRKKDQ